MSESIQVVDFLLRRACRRAEGDLSLLNSCGEMASTLLASEGDGAIGDDNASTFITLLRGLNDPGIDKEIETAELMASAPTVQSDPLTIITIGASLALIIFALRFTDIAVSRPS